MIMVWQGRGDFLGEMGVPENGVDLQNGNSKMGNYHLPVNVGIQTHTLPI